MGGITLALSRAGVNPKIYLLAAALAALVNPGTALLPRALAA
jgi:hypothetical protein